MSQIDTWKNKLYYGDNLDVMRKYIPNDSIDLIYLDPPFKSDLDYNVLYHADGLSSDEAQWTAFKDTWFWDTEAERIFAELQDVPNPKLVGLLNALETSLYRSPMFAYIVNMSIRLSLLQNFPHNWCLRCRNSHVMAIIVVVAIIDSIFRSLGHIFSISGRIYSVLGLSGAICK